MPCHGNTTADAYASAMLRSADAAAKANANADAVLCYAAMLSQLWFMLVVFLQCYGVLWCAMICYTVLCHANADAKAMSC